MTIESEDDAGTSIEDCANRWIDDQPPGADVLTTPRAALDLAWALKALCYAAWSSEPQRAGRAARALDALAGMSDRLSLPPDEQVEIRALARWTAAIASLAQGRMQEAILHLDEAGALFVALGRPAETAQTQVPRIIALNMLSRFDEAVACAASAHAQFVALGDARSAAKVSLNLGSLHLRRDHYPEAARDYREAAVLFARIADHEHSVMADIGVGDALTAQGLFDDARHMYLRALNRARVHGFQVLEAMVDESMALLELACGNFRAALAGFERSRRGYAALDMPQQSAVAEKQLADAYLDLGLLPEAIALYERSLVQLVDLELPVDRAWALVALGRAQALTTQWAAAAASFETAADVFQAQASTVGESAVRLARAEMSLRLHEPPAEAAALAQMAADGFRAAGSVLGEARAALTVAEAVLVQGDLALARRAFEQALLQARSSQLRAVQTAALTGLGMTALAGGDVDGARAALVAAVGMFEEQRAALPGDDLRHAFLQDHLRPYQALLRIALEVQRADPTPAHAAAVLHDLERFRASALTLRLARGQFHDAQVPPAVSTLRTRLNWLERRIQRTEEEGGASADLERSRQATEQELLETMRRDRLVADGAHETWPPALQRRDDLTIALAGALQAGDALVAFGQDNGVWFACVADARGVAVEPVLAPVAEVDEALRAARFQIETLRSGAARLAAHGPQLTRRAMAHLERLHELLWEPLCARVADCRRIIVVPPASLGGLPFAALHRGGVALGQRHALCVAPSVALALRLLARPLAPARHALVLGVGQRLLHANAEARAVGDMLPGATVLLDEAATLAALERHAASATVLHLACHGEFRADNPMFSALHLHDGALTAEAVERLRLPAGLVVLSACDTGVGDDSPGDEHIGLVRAFFVAGAARVVASLWPVDDGVTAEFMTTFYEELGRGLAPSAALQRAQTSMRERHPHPYHWAAFALYGGW